MSAVVATLGQSSNSTAVPVHDYWLEHRRSMLAEMAIQREEMLNHVAATQRSAFLGIDLLENKLERQIQDLRSDAKMLLTDIQNSLAEGWRSVAAQHEHLAKVTMELNEENEKMVTAAKTRHMKDAEQEAYLRQRRSDVEEWAESTQKSLMHQEQDLSSKSRAIERDMGVLMQAKQKELHKGSRHMHHFAKITFAESNKLDAGGFPRVVVGQPVHLTFNVSPCAALVGMPAIITYLEGKAGSVQGHIVGIVNKKGQIHFENLIVQGRPGTSHILLVSIPRLAAGTVESIELPVHLMTQPDVRATGFWVMKEKKLVARIKVAGVETFGLVGISISVTLNICDQTFHVVAAANETNEFPFEISLAATKLKWEDIAGAKAMVETQVPVTKYTTAFFHRFEVKIHSEAYPSFQYPSRDLSVDCGVAVAPLDIPYTELITETAVNDNGRLMATSDVSGTVRILMSQDGCTWECRHVIKHQSFISRMAWGCGGSTIALLEPRQGKVHVWSMADLAKCEEVISMGKGNVRSTSTFTEVPNASLMCLLGTYDLMIVSQGAVLTASTSKSGVTSVSELLPASHHTVSLLSHTIIQSLGNLALIGFTGGAIAIYGLNTRKHIFTGQVETKDSVVDIQVVEEGKILVATASAISLLSMYPSWGIVTSSFRTPSPVSCICTPLPEIVKKPSQWAAKRRVDNSDDEKSGPLLSSSSPNLRVLIVHSDGNLCVLDVDTDHVLGYGLLKGVTQPLASTKAIAYDAQEFRLVGCRSLNPVGWGIKLIPTSDAHRRYHTRDAVFEVPLEGVPATGTTPILVGGTQAVVQEQGSNGESQPPPQAAEPEARAPLPESGATDNAIVVPAVKKESSSQRPATAAPTAGMKERSTSLNSTMSGSEAGSTRKPAVPRLRSAKK